MIKIRLITAHQVIKMNQMICARDGNISLCYDPGKVESALHSSFYPGSYPFQNGGIVSVAGAMAFYVTRSHAFADGNKRTAVVASTSFMKLNGWILKYPISQQANALADIIESCALEKSASPTLSLGMKGIKAVASLTDHNTISFSPQRPPAAAVSLLDPTLLFR